MKALMAEGFDRLIEGFHATRLNVGCCVLPPCSSSKGFEVLR